MTRFHLQLYVDIYQHDYLVPPKRSVDTKFYNSRIRVEFDVTICTKLQYGE